MAQSEVPVFKIGLQDQVVGGGGGFSLASTPSHCAKLGQRFVPRRLTNVEIYNSLYHGDPYNNAGRMTFFKISNFNHRVNFVEQHNSEVFRMV